MKKQLGRDHDLKMEVRSSSDRYGTWHKDMFESQNSRVFPLTRGRQGTGDVGGIVLGLPSQRWLLIVGDLVLIMIASYLSALIRFGTLPDNLLLYLRPLGATLFLYPIAFYVFDLYNPGRYYRSWEVAYRSFFSVLLVGILTMFLYYFLTERPYARVMLAIQMVLALSFTNGWRWLYARMFQHAVKKTPVLVVGAGKCGKTIADLLDSPFSMYDVRGFIDDDPNKQGKRMSPTVIGACSDLVDIARNIGAETAILAIPQNRSAKLIRKILEARLQGIAVKEMADVYEQHTGRIPINFVGDQWLLFAEGFYLLHKDYIQKLKRLVDLISAGVLIILTAPLLGLVSLAIRLESPGPILYKQHRVGKGEKLFTIFKFRSMLQNSEPDGAQWAVERDPRVTRIGRWLRLTHIDELPQLWNIFIGDMSIVGPRPERPEFVKMLQENVPYYFIRHSVRPGVTGWAQINYHYGSSVEDTSRKLEHDLYYVKNMSLFLDFQILLRTIGVVLMGDGAR